MPRLLLSSYIHFIQLMHKQMFFFIQMDHGKSSDNSHFYNNQVLYFIILLVVYICIFFFWFLDEWDGNFRIGQFGVEYN